MKDQVDTLIIAETLADESRVVFAYLYGSMLEDVRDVNDLDIAVYADPECDFFLLSTDIKIALHERTGAPADFFDVRVINDLIAQGDLFSLLYLRRVFDGKCVLADKNFKRRSDFIEMYNLKYRSCEGLIAELLA